MVTKKGTKVTSSTTEKVVEKTTAEKPVVKAEAVKTAGKVEAAKPAAKVEAVKPVAKTEPVEAPKASVKKGTAAKTSAKKSTAKKPAAKKEMKVRAVVEYYGKQVEEKDMIASVKKAWTRSGKKVGDIKTMELYIKPEEAAVYYVINGTDTGAVAF